MSKITSKLKPFFFALVGFFAAVGILSFSHVGPAQAQSPGVNLAALVATVNALKSQVSTLQANLAAETTRATNAESALQTRATTLETKTAPLSVSNDPNAGGVNTLLTTKGVNVQIVNGMNSTETRNGLGNLIVGYDEKDPQYTQARTGSHNIVVGMGNNYLSYGGIVAGQSNDISGPYASAVGGQDNIANSDHASVFGGQSNAASSDHSCVSSGYQNIASGSEASVSGGIQNVASKTCASVSGGQYNVADGSYSSVSGGNSNIAAAFCASVSGGANLSQSTGNGWSAGSAFTGPGTDKTGNFHSP